MASQIGPQEALVLLSSIAGQGSFEATLPAHWKLPGVRRPIETALRPGRVSRVEASVSPFGLAQQWRIPRLAGEIGAQIYHSPYYLMPYRMRLPTLFTLYDLIPQLFPRYVSLRARLLYRLATRLALRAATHVITISEATRADLLSHFDYPEERVSAIPLAPGPEFVPQSEGAQRRIRRKYHLPEHFVLFLGINKPHKNLENLIKAWKRVLDASSQPRLMLAIAGAWDERYPQAKVMALRGELTHSIRFLGPIPEGDLPALYSAATLFVFPSFYEGFGLPVVEAMACGTPVACSNRSSLPEVAGTAGVLFDPHDPADIAAAVVRLLSDHELRSQKSEQGLQQASQFSWEHCAAQTLDLYRRILGSLDNSDYL